MNIAGTEAVFVQLQRYAVVSRRMAAASQCTPNKRSSLSVVITANEKFH